MEDSNGTKPFMVSSSMSFQVNTPSFYNQPKKFASVAPPRPKGPSYPAAFSSSTASTGVIGRVGEMPPPPSTISDDFPPPPPPPPPLDDAELPAPPPECQLTPPAFEAPPPAFPAPPPVADDLSLPAPPEDVSFAPINPSAAPPPPPPPPPPAPPLPLPGTGVTSKKPLDKQTSFDRQLGSLTDMLSEMETRKPFTPKMPSQPSYAPAPKAAGPPPTAPKPALSFLPPPELQDRPPPAPWAEELRARTTLRQPGPSPASAPSPAQPVAKSFAAAPKTTFTPSQPSSNVGPKPASSASFANTRAANQVPKAATQSSFAPPPAGPPAPPSAPPSAPPPPASVPTPAFSHSKALPSFSQEKVAPPPSTSSYPRPMTSPGSSYNRSVGVPPPANPPPAKASTPAGPATGAPPAGAPLSMREVEELERMTKDFIKDMDKRAPLSSVPTEVCGNCGEALSRSQPAVRAMDKLFHSHCFCCVSCHRALQGMQFYDRDGSPECEDCYVNSLAICSRCGERIMDRVLKAVGQCFHAHCFRCSVCNCTLEGAPFITDDAEKPYCVPDYHRRFSPLCVSCNEPIIPDPGSEETVRVVALEKNFHLKCYRCEDCARPLSIEADADGCYPLNGRILCMKCHTQRAKQAMQ
ncbi:LOW QUALITY PROTEIN: zyxin [Brachyhypopomus gauderio]|uniref:LOW QUALITY PROTEIN: zyxin n=1 Tax=Brachyhypopomus gauderio TaxID=698409 RepID=UPI0040412E43